MFRSSRFQSLELCSAAEQTYTVTQRRDKIHIPSIDRPFKHYLTKCLPLCVVGQLFYRIILLYYMQHIMYYGAVAQWLALATRDRKVASSIPGRGIPRNNLG